MHAPIVLRLDVDTIDFYMVWEFVFEVCIALNNLLTEQVDTEMD